MNDASLPNVPPLPPLRSSDAAINVIVVEEDSGQAYYERHYEHFDWPLGASGPTAGIGYDCGYSTASQIRQDWQDFVSPGTVAALMRAAQITGNAAHEFVERYANSVTITWTQAMAQFRAHELPKWEARIEAALPNTSLLSGDSFGALTSLGFNRGTGGFHDPSPRDIEMRNITAHMAAKEFGKIPGEFMAMRRLWPKGKDLWNRRTHEAALFAQGLAVVPSAVHLTNA
jgi:hypothetical protein